jgi:hypothetical protein
VSTQPLRATEIVLVQANEREMLRTVFAEDLQGYVTVEEELAKINVKAWRAF